MGAFTRRVTAPGTQKGLRARGTSPSPGERAKIGAWILSTAFLPFDWQGVGNFLEAFDRHLQALKSTNRHDKVHAVNEVGERRISRARDKVFSKGRGSLRLEPGEMKIFVTLRTERPRLGRRHHGIDRGEHPRPGNAKAPLAPGRAGLLATDRGRTGYWTFQITPVETVADS